VSVGGVDGNFYRFVVEDLEGVIKKKKKKQKKNKKSKKKIKKKKIV